MEDTNNLDMLKVFQKTKDMSELFNYNQKDNQEEGSTEKDRMDMDKMMKLFEIASLLNSNKGNSISPPKKETAESTPPDNDSEHAYSTEYFDRRLQTPALKSIKAALPHIEFKYRKPLSIFIKMIEIQKLLDIYNDIIVSLKETSQDRWQHNLMLSMRPYMDDNSRNMIDTCIRFMEIQKTMSSFSNMK